ncbi:hypothetical protein GHT06_013673 [Daphnia sinensis]|uniref:MULE transposase domain-containing protein n=1 Tax=Daphnia sinensis TaxID=1820382 RepID=A0AAD5LKX1_9CRUS|nr:hypothetical protein GHT06_013673 [Daphnia sinensis]
MESLHTPQTVEDAAMPATVEEVRQYIIVTLVPGTRKNSYRYNTECVFIFYKKDMRLIDCHCKITISDGLFTQTGAHNHDAQFGDHPVFKETIPGDLFFHGTVRSYERNDVPWVGLIFISLLLLCQLGEATSMHLDGTFPTVPALFYQLLTNHVIVHNKAFPVAFVLMARKTRHLYTSVLRFIIRMSEDRFPENPITINDFVTDFELALMGAVSDVMDVESRGSSFHYGQATIRKSEVLHLNRN